MARAMRRREPTEAATAVDIRRLVVRAFVLPLALMAIVAGCLAWQVGRLMTAGRWVDRADRAVAQANEVGRLIIDQETGVRAFLLTENRLFLEPYERAQPEAALAALEAMEAGDPDQLARLRELHADYLAWAEATRRAIARPVDARGGEALLARKAEMDTMRGVLASFVAHAQDQRAARSRQVERETTITASAAAALVVAVALAIALLSRRQLRRVASTYQEALARVASSEAALGRLVDREREAREKAQEAVRLKDEFLSTLSHELRTPLTAILGWTAVLRARPRPPEAPGAAGAPPALPSPELTARALGSIDRNARAQAQIVDDLLDMSRIVNGKLRLDLARMDLAAVVRAAIDVVGFSAESKGVRVDASGVPAALSIVGDAHRLQQVLWNLLSNAIKFTPQGGRVEVGASRAGESARIVVRDSGEGIAQEFLPHVFERFRQGDASVKRAHGGLGLGLSIVKLLVEMHGGEVRAESAGPGLGSTFTVTLPVTRGAEGAAEPAAASVPPPPDAAAPLSGVRVLVIDDEPDSLEVISMILSGHGAQVTPAASAADALGILDRAEVDVIVSDLAMPELDGYELLERIRRRKRRRPLPAVALSAYARAEDVERARAAGFQRHLPKPVSAAQLVETVTGLAREA
jgi:signal transduction histidine kinase